MKLFDFNKPLSSEDEVFLAAFFRQQSQKHLYWEEDTSYRFNDEEVIFKQAVVWRLGKDEKKERYQVLSDLLAVPANSFVYHSKQTLAIKAGRCQIKIKDRIVKRQRCDDPEDADIVVNEVKMAKRTPHTKAKPVTFHKDRHCYTFFTQTKHQGCDLFDILRRDLDCRQRLLLSIRLLTALKTQVHDCGILHGDLKPENVILNMRDGTVNWIDFGWAQDKSVPIECGIFGSFEFLCPEHFNDSIAYSQASEVFIMGRVLAEVWGADINPLIEGDVLLAKRACFGAAITFIREYSLTDSGLDFKVACSVRDIILSMLNNDKNLRPRLEQVIDAFHQLLPMESELINHGPRSRSISI